MSPPRSRRIPPAQVGSSCSRPRSGQRGFRAAALTAQHQAEVATARSAYRGILGDTVSVSSIPYAVWRPLRSIRFNLPQYTAVESVHGIIVTPRAMCPKRLHGGRPART